MKKERISNNVIRRMPMYLRKLDDLSIHGVDRISSGELGKQMGLTPSQIRQDFSCFGEFGQQGYGYRVTELREQVSRILGMHKGFTVAIVGVGNLGHALIANFGFEEQGFKLVAAFDSSPDIAGKVISNTPVYDSALLADWLKRNPTDIVILTVPRTIAKSMAETVADCGVKGIWNFTNIELELGRPDVRVENIHFSDSLHTLGYFLSEMGNMEK
ncbi:MAG: redox-sensing transcriptional repressor Rex [Oscillospiraceae bacterium]|nr:redox-sensing transcriptional repressor Rex [Oscillospiraceae bacterium]